MCLCGGFAEDNARIILLAVVLAAYMLAGAALFQRLESDLEIRQVQNCHIAHMRVLAKNYSYLLVAIVLMGNNYKLKKKMCIPYF